MNVALFLIETPQRPALKLRVLFLVVFLVPKTKMLDFSARAAALRILNEFTVPKKPALKFYGFQNSLKSKLGVGFLKMRGPQALCPHPGVGPIAQARLGQARPGQTGTG